jgi:dihydroorotase
MDCLPAGHSFDPLMSVSVTDKTTPAMIREAKAAGALVGKLYPVGSTTNSENGCSDIRLMGEVLSAMEDCGLPLSIHGEDPSVPCLERETAYLPVLDWLVGLYPRLKVILEHVSTKEAVRKVLGLPENVAATITPHHLVLTLDDVIGGVLKSHNYCKPVAKAAADREALRLAAMSGSPKFFLGTDSAPHTSLIKAFEGAAGVFSAPVALPVLTQVFEERGYLDRLNDFVSRFGAEFYGLPRNGGQVELVREPWTVWNIDALRPLMHGETLAWRVKTVSR